MANLVPQQRQGPRYRPEAGRRSREPRSTRRSIVPDRGGPIVADRADLPTHPPAWGSLLVQRYPLTGAYVLCSNAGRPRSSFDPRLECRVRFDERGLRAARFWDVGGQPRRTPSTALAPALRKPATTFTGRCRAASRGSLHPVTSPRPCRADSSPRQRVRHKDGPGNPTGHHRPARPLARSLS